MTVTPLDHKKAVTSGSAVTTAAMNNTGAKALIAVADYFSTGSPPVITDSVGGNTWTARVTKAAASGIVWTTIYDCLNGNVSGSQTVTATGSGDTQAITLFTLSFAEFDTYAGVSNSLNNGTTTQGSGSITTSANGALIISALKHITNGTPLASGLTVSDSHVHGVSGAQGGAIAWGEQATAGAIDTTWSWDGSDSSPHVSAAIVAYNKIAVATTGAVSATLANVTPSAAGALAITGTASKTLADVTVSTNASGAGTGVVNSTLANATVAASGVLAIVGTTTKTLANVTVSAVGAPPTTAMGIDDPEREVYQRGPGATSLLMHFTGTYSGGAPASAQVKVDIVGGSNLVAYTTLSSFAASGGVWSGDLTVPEGTLQTMRYKATAKEPASGSTSSQQTTSWVVGWRVSTDGQSNANYAAQLLAYLQSISNVPVAVNDCYQSATTIAQWQPGGAAWNSMMTILNNPFFGVDHEAAIFSQGEGNTGGGGGPTTDYDNQVRNVRAGLWAITGRDASTFKFGVSLIGCSIGYGDSDKWHIIRGFQYQVAQDGAGTFFAGSDTDLLLSDIVHHPVLEYERGAERKGEALLYAMGLATHSRRGPIIRYAHCLPGSTDLIIDVGHAPGAAALVDGLGANNGTNLAGFSFASTVGGQSFGAPFLSGGKIHSTLGIARAGSGEVITFTYCDPQNPWGWAGSNDPGDTRNDLVFDDLDDPLLPSTSSHYATAGVVTVAEAPSEIFGASSLNVAGVAVASAGALGIAGTVGRTLAAVTAVAAGGGPSSAGVTATLGAVTVTAAGQSPIAGIVNRSLSDVTLSAFAAGAGTGTVGITIGAVTLAAAGSATVNPIIPTVRLMGEIDR